MATWTTFASQTVANPLAALDNDLLLLRDQTPIWGGVATGSPNAIAISTSPSLGYYADGQSFNFVPASNNTGSTTVNINSIGAITVKKNGSNLSGGEFVAGQVSTVQYYNGFFQILNTVGTSNVLTNPTITGGVETFTNATWTGSITLTVSTGANLNVSLTGNTTLTVTPSSLVTLTVVPVVLRITQASGGSHTITWDARVKWVSGGTAPTLTTTVGAVDTFLMTSWNQGTTFDAFVVGQNGT